MNGRQPDAHGLYRAPRDCPVCSEELHTTRLGCANCGTELSGAFCSCEYCGLSDADRELLRVFLVSRGTMREVERHLKVSYPTARVRFDDVVRRLGFAVEPAPEPAEDPRLEALRAVADGRLDVETARRRLGGD